MTQYAVFSANGDSAWIKTGDYDANTPEDAIEKAIKERVQGEPQAGQELGAWAAAPVKHWTEAAPAAEVETRVKVSVNSNRVRVPRGKRAAAATV